MFEKSKINHHTFLGLLKLDSTIDLLKLAKEFKLDVSLDSEGLHLIQNDKIIDKSFKIYNSCRYINKTINNDNITGFVKISYPLNSELMLYTNPPEFIPIGCYCINCLSNGPHTHKNNCNRPKKNSLYLTTDGLFQVLTNNKILDKNVNINEYLKNYCDFTNIPLSKYVNMTKKDTNNFFSGPVMLKYINSSSKCITIRIRSSGYVEIISNPWSDKYLYKILIDKINETSQQVNFKSLEIRTFFSSVNIKKNKEFNIDINKLYNYIWPNEKNIPISSYPMYKQNNNFYINHNTVYKYIVYKDNKSNNRLYIEFIKENYKISVQFFSQGQIQFTFGFENYNLLFEDQYQIIDSEFNNILDYIIKMLNELYIIDNNVCINIEKKNISSKIYETIDGCIPYSKVKKYRIGDKVNIYSFKKFKWSDKVGMISNIIDDKILVKFKNKTIESKINEIRKISINNDQVCRVKENGVYRQPYPYSFIEGICPGGYDQLIKPYGINSRSDNKFYPCCIDVKQKDEEWLINFIFNGFTDKEKKDYLLLYKNIDIMCGTFKPGTCNIGSEVMVKYNNKWEIAKIYDKYKSHGKGNDNIMVYYKLVKDEIEFEATGRDFHPKYIENRNFDGIKDNLEILEKVLIKLDIIKDKNKINSVFNIDRLDILNIENIKNRYNVIIPKNLNKCKIIICDNNFTFENEYTTIKTNVTKLNNIEIHGFYDNDNFYFVSSNNNELFNILLDKYKNCIKNIMNLEFNLYYYNLSNSFSNIQKYYSYYMHDLIFINKNDYTDKIGTISKIRRTFVGKIIEKDKSYFIVNIGNNNIKIEKSIEYKINDYIKIKPNIMIDNTPNPINPYIVVGPVEYMDEEIEIANYNYINNSINYNVFNNKIWIFNDKIIDYENVGNKVCLI